MKTTSRVSGEASQSGFTLIEVAVAMGILALEIAAVIAMFATSTRSSSYARRMTAATVLAQNRIETAKNTAFANLPLPLASDGETVSGSDLVACFDRDQTPVACGSANAIYTRTTTIANFLDGSGTAVTGMMQATVRVSWDDDSGNVHDTTMASAVSRY